MQLSAHTTGALSATKPTVLTSFEATDFNAVLFSEVCKELAALKAAQAATEQQVGITVLKLTADTREAVEELHKRDAGRDETLRGELSAMAA